MSIRASAERSGEITVTILDAVAACHGTDAQDIDHKLADVIDPDSLSQLWALENEEDPTADGEVSFDFYDCSVTVRSDGMVIVTQSG